MIVPKVSATGVEPNGGTCPRIAAPDAARMTGPIATIPQCLLGEVLPFALLRPGLSADELVASSFVVAPPAWTFALAAMLTVIPLPEQTPRNRQRAMSMTAEPVDASNES